MIAAIEPCPAFQSERDMMRAGSQAMAKMLRLHLGMDWPCGHARSPETTQTVAGVPRCRVCRRARWNAGFRRAVIRLSAKAERRRVLVDQLTRANRATAEARRQKLKEITEAFSGRLPLQELLFCVAASFNISVAELKGASRRRECVHPRAVAAKILTQRGCSTTQVARFLGRRDHSTIINALGKWDIYVRRDPRVLNAYRAYGDAS